MKSFEKEVFDVNRELEKNLLFVKEFIIEIFYKESENSTKEWIEGNFVKFLEEVIKDDKEKFSVEEQNYFEL